MLMELVAPYITRICKQCAIDQIEYVYCLVVALSTAHKEPIGRKAPNCAANEFVFVYADSRFQYIVRQSIIPYQVVCAVYKKAGADQQLSLGYCHASLQGQ